MSYHGAENDKITNEDVQRVFHEWAFQRKKKGNQTNATLAGHPRVFSDALGPYYEYSEERIDAGSADACAMPSIVHGLTFFRLNETINDTPYFPQTVRAMSEAAGEGQPPVIAGRKHVYVSVSIRGWALMRVPAEGTYKGSSSHKRWILSRRHVCSSTPPG